MSYKDHQTCRRFRLFIPSLLFCLGLQAQSNFDAVDQLLKQNQKTLGNFVALAWKDGKPVYQKQSPRQLDQLIDLVEEFEDGLIGNAR